MRLTTRGLQYRPSGAGCAGVVQRVAGERAHVAGHSYGALTGLARSSPRRSPFGGPTPAPRDGCPYLARNERCCRSRRRARMCATHRRPRASGAHQVKYREHRRTLPPMLRSRIVTRRKSTVGPKLTDGMKAHTLPSRPVRRAPRPAPETPWPSRSASNTPFDVPLA